MEKKIGRSERIIYNKIAAPVSYEAIIELDKDKPYLVEKYAESSLQIGQLWLPEELNGDALIPVIVFIHGGCWLSEYDIKHTEAAVTALKDQGYVVWSIEYRRIGDSGGGWPGTFNDISNAVDHVKKLCTRYPLDINRVILMGHSAGGHLALWAAGRSAFHSEHPLYVSDPLNIHTVISLSGITDLITYSKGAGPCNQSVDKLFNGTSEEQRDRFMAGSPMELSNTNVQVILFHGIKDDIVPIEQAKTFADYLYQSRGINPIRLIENAGHFDFIHPGSLAWQGVLKVLIKNIPTV